MLNILKTKPGPYAKYEFPRVVITGTQVCCGFRPCFLQNGTYAYKDQGGIVSPYTDMDQVIFAMCYFSKHLHLHHYTDRVLPDGHPGSYRYIDVTVPPGGTMPYNAQMFPGGGPGNFRYWTIDPSRALLLTHNTGVMAEIKDFINKHKLGEIVSMPDWQSKVTYANLGTCLWWWNSKVPPVDSVRLIDFPFDNDGRCVPGRTNLRDHLGKPVFISEPAPEIAAA